MNPKAKKILKWAGLIASGALPVFPAFSYPLFYGLNYGSIFIFGAFYFFCGFFYQRLSEMKVKHVALGLTLGFGPFAFLSIAFNAAMLGILALTLVFTIAFAGAFIAHNIRYN